MNVFGYKQGDVYFALTNEQTGKITFHPETPQYKAEKSPF